LFQYCLHKGPAMHATKKKVNGQEKRIVVVDDHPLVRDGLSLLINREPDLMVCGEAGNSEDALAAIDGMKPNLVLMDISIEGRNGLDVTKGLRRTHPDLPVLVLSMHDEALYAERALRAGARGYLMKQEAPEVVLKAIRVVLAGKVYVSAAISSRILNELVDYKDVKQGRFGVRSLSDRQLEVFELIGQGATTPGIAKALRLSVKTIETHRKHIKAKLGLRNATELMRQAVQWVESASSRQA
jgi:DNA-binding NarL/FixJ family response regulator